MLVNKLIINKKQKKHNKYRVMQQPCIVHDDEETHKL